MERLLKNIVLIEYPKDKLEIQVLDDSTDESVESTAVFIKNLQKEGFNIQHIQRKIRKGFKAGALREGLNVAKGEYIAIFDADFLPKSDWLKRTIPYFKDEKIGVAKNPYGYSKATNEAQMISSKINSIKLDSRGIR